MFFLMLVAVRMYHTSMSMPAKILSSCLIVINIKTSCTVVTIGAAMEFVAIVTALTICHSYGLRHDHETQTQCHDAARSNFLLPF